MPEPDEKKQPRTWSKPDPTKFGPEDFDENGEDGSNDEPWFAPGHQAEDEPQEQPAEEQ